MQNVIPNDSAAKHLTKRMSGDANLHLKADLKPGAFKEYFSFQGRMCKRKSGFKPTALHIPEQLHDKAVKSRPDAIVTTHIIGR